MNPPDVSPDPTKLTQTPCQQQPQPASDDTISIQKTNSIQSITINTKPQIITTTQIQQTPLALTTTTITTATTTLPPAQTRTQLPLSQIPTPTQTSAQSPTQPQLSQQIQPKLIQPTTITGQPIALASTPTSTGPTALVIIPQHANSTSANTAKGATKKTSLSSVNVTATHVTLTPSTQSAPIQLQAQVTTHIPTIGSIPVVAHQTPANQPALSNRLTTTLPTLPTNAAPTIVKAEPNKYICCLLDSGIRCDRIAGNASFNARIQKIVGTKKMNFALDPTVRHAYICEHHKAIITVAKKSTPLARDTKSNAKNHTGLNNPSAINAQNLSNYNDPTRSQSHQHPVNLELMNSQNRLSKGNAGSINAMNVRPGNQLAYSHYQSPLPNQVGSMDVMMSGGFDSTGGDSVPSCSGGIDVDLQQLQVNTLRRYKRHFRVQTRPGLNKMQLAESLKSHFRTLPIIEKEAITYFVYIVKCYRNKLDHNPKAD